MMLNRNSQIKRMCSFYVSAWHLISMILPYIKEKLKEEKKIINISENNLTEFVEVFASKLSLKDDELAKILNIDWDNEKKIEIDIEENSVIIVSGSKEYIDRVNSNITSRLKTHKDIKNFTIINCYEVMQFNNNINAILKKHDKILNTSGEKDISEVFDGYGKAINE